MRRWLERGERWLTTAYRMDDRALGLARIGFAAYMLFLVGVPSFTWIADAPQLLFNPPVVSPANLLAGWPPPWFLWLLSAGVVIGFVLILLGIWTRAASLAVGVLLLIGFNLSYSFGKIDHDVLLALAPLVMSYSGWGNALALRPPRMPRPAVASAMALGVLAILVGFAMLTAAYPKVRAGWLDPSTQAVYGHLIENYVVHGRHELLAPLAVSIHLPALWELFDYSAVLFEGLFILTVWRPALFRTWLLLAVFFHLANLLILDIGFSYNIAAYLVFVDWRPLLRRVAPWAGGFVRAGPMGIGLVVVAALGPWLAGVLSGDLFLRANPSLANLGLAAITDEAHDVLFHVVPIGGACVAALAAAWISRDRWMPFRG